MDSEKAGGFVLVVFGEANGMEESLPFHIVLQALENSGLGFGRLLGQALEENWKVSYLYVVHVDGIEDPFKDIGKFPYVSGPRIT